MGKDATETAAVCGLLVLLSTGIFCALYFRRRSGHGPTPTEMSRARLIVFAATGPLWLALFLFATQRVGVDPSGPVPLIVGLVVLFYITLEVRVISGYTGSYSDLEGDKAEAPAERSVRLATIAFALGTLLVSQKDPELTRRVGALVFVGLLFCVIPSLASGPAAKRKTASDPYFAAVQRACLTLGAGVIAVALAVCVSGAAVPGSTAV
jgi:hypothetical protein